MVDREQVRRARRQPSRTGRRRIEPAAKPLRWTLRFEDGTVRSGEATAEPIPRRSARPGAPTHRVRVGGIDVDVAGGAHERTAALGNDARDVVQDGAQDPHRQPVDEVMEERPEHPVGVPLVVSGHQVLRERHCNEALGAQLPVQLRLLLAGEVVPGARPADPEALGLLVRTGEPGGQAPRAPLDLHAIGRSTDGYGEPVGDDQEVSGHVVNLTGWSEHESERWC